jgi:Lon protease-like protein
MGRRRFKIQRAFEQDGYRVAVPQWLRDTPPAEGSPEAAELPALAKEVLELTAKITDSLRFVDVWETMTRRHRPDLMSQLTTACIRTD